MYPFEYVFFRDDLGEANRASERLGTIARRSPALAVLMGSLALLGLSSSAAAQQTRETGAQEALGASTPHATLLLSWRYGQWVPMANVVAWPLGYCFTYRWLQGSACRVDLAWWLFVLPVGGTPAVALVTASYQGFGAALFSPVPSLTGEWREMTPQPCW